MKAVITRALAKAITQGGLFDTAHLHQETRTNKKGIAVKKWIKNPDMQGNLFDEAHVQADKPKGKPLHEGMFAEKKPGTTQEEPEYTQFGKPIPGTMRVTSGKLPPKRSKSTPANMGMFEGAESKPVMQPGEKPKAKQQEPANLSPETIDPVKDYASYSKQVQKLWEKIKSEARKGIPRNDLLKDIKQAKADWNAHREKMVSHAKDLERVHGSSHPKFQKLRHSLALTANSPELERVIEDAVGTIRELEAKKAKPISDKPTLAAQEEKDEGVKALRKFQDLARKHGLEHPNTIEAVQDLKKKLEGHPNARQLHKESMQTIKSLK